MYKYLVNIAFFIIVISSCQKRPNPQQPIPDTMPKVNIQLHHMANGRQLVLKEDNYTTVSGDTFSVTMFNYFISHISLISDETEYQEDSSYRLIAETNSATKSFMLKDVSEGNYSGIRFLIGIDSAASALGVQSPVYKIGSGMFWEWNTGFVMAKLEGTSPNAETGFVYYHIGGYSGPNSALRWVTLEFPAPVRVEKNRAVSIDISANVDEWFKTPNPIKISEASILMMPGPGASRIADNYADMFSISNISYQ